MWCCAKLERLWRTVFRNVGKAEQVVGSGGECGHSDKDVVEMRSEVSLRGREDHIWDCWMHEIR